MPGSRTPGKVQVVPASVVYPQPACLKLDVTSSNCLQPIVILVPLVGSTESTHSFAASPTIFWPLASTFTWKLVNVSNFEIIRGEVAIIRKGAGGLSYVSSGTPRGTRVVGASWPEARGIKTSESRQVKTAAFDILKRIIVNKSSRNRRRWSKQMTSRFAFVARRPGAGFPRSSAIVAARGDGNR